MANTPNVLQPYWLILLPLDVPHLTASLLLWDPSGQRWRCLWTFLFSNVPTFATSRLQENLAAKVGTTWTRKGRWILPESARLPRNIQGSLHAVNLRHGTNGFTSPPEEGVLRSFSPWKIRRSGLNQRTGVPKAGTLPLDPRSRYLDLHCVTGNHVFSEIFLGFSMRMRRCSIVTFIEFSKSFFINCTRSYSIYSRYLTFKTLASHIWDGRKITL